MRTRVEIEADLARIQADVTARFDAAKGSPLSDLFCDVDDYLRPEEAELRARLEAELEALKSTAGHRKPTPQKERSYQCVMVGETWHLTQEQANPPPILRMESWTSCALWAVFKKGFEKRLPTCAECLRHVEEFERRRAAIETLNELPSGA